MRQVRGWCQRPAGTTAALSGSMALGPRYLALTTRGTSSHIESRRLSKRLDAGYPPHLQNPLSCEVAFRVGVNGTFTSATADTTTPLLV